MGVIDIIIICCFFPAILIGLKRGLVSQLVSVLVVYFGIKFSLRFCDVVSEWILQVTNFNPTTVRLISFLLIFIIVALLLNIVGGLVERFIKITTLGWLNRLLGIVLTTLITLIILSVAIYLINSANELFNVIPQQTFDESKLFKPLLEFANRLFPYLKSLF